MKKKTYLKKESTFRTQIILLQILQYKSLRIISKDRFVYEKVPRYIEQQFDLESIFHHYATLSIIIY